MCSEGLRGAESLLKVGQLKRRSEAVISENDCSLCCFACHLGGEFQVHVSTRVKLQDVDLVPQHTQVELKVELVCVLCVSCGHASVSFRNRFEVTPLFWRGNVTVGGTTPHPPHRNPAYSHMSIPCINTHCHTCSDTTHASIIACSIINKP